MVPMLAVGSGVMLLPATLGALIAEAFAIRSWMYHAANGGLSAAVSLVSIGGFEKTYDLSDEPLIAVGAGIVGRLRLLGGGRLERGLLEAGVRAAAGRSPPPAAPLAARRHRHKKIAGLLARR